jgi:hypothetical protein
MKGKNCSGVAAAEAENAIVPIANAPKAAARQEFSFLRNFGETPKFRSCWLSCNEISSIHYAQSIVIPPNVEASKFIANFENICADMMERSLNIYSLMHRGMVI